MQQRLALTAAIALLSSSCGSQSTSFNPPPVTDQNADEKIPAVFYKTTEECETDVQKQQDAYAVSKTAFTAGQLATEPIAPPFQKEDCAPQMLAAQQAHAQNAPTYASLADCQAEGLACEPSSTAQTTGYYQPRFGGSYFYPFGRTEYIYVNYLGSQRRLYQPSTVYQSATPGQVVTPNGRVVTTGRTGIVTAPLHTTVPAPPRPQGTAARGTITGRGSQGFGSTYKSTGSGGK